MKQLDLQIAPFADRFAVIATGQIDNYGACLAAMPVGALHKTREDAADALVAIFMEASEVGPDACEPTDDDSLVYSMEDGTVIEVLKDGRALHLDSNDFEKLAGGFTVEELLKRADEYEQASLRG